MITGPTYSWGRKITALMIGSRTSSTLEASGSLDGLETCSTVPSFISTSYTTVGAVVMRFMSNSRSRRSWTISMCRRPRKPQRKPKPSACETSGSNCSEASLRRSFSRDSRSWSYSLDSTGVQAREHLGLDLLETGQRLAAGRRRG